jgi:transcriptional regulator with XRE-family HTH domain
MRGVATVSASPDDLRTRRRRLGLTQQALAAAAECSLSAVRLYEAGFTPTRSPTRDRIAHVLDALEREPRGGAVAGMSDSSPREQTVAIAETSRSDGRTGSLASGGQGQVCPIAARRCGDRGHDGGAEVNS